METFQEYLQAWPAERRAQAAANATEADVLAALQKELLQPADLLALLSPAAAPHLEAMARRARDLTLRFFGRAVHIFTPLYISDVCTNQCRYCGFNAKNKQPRRHLSIDEAAEGLKLNRRNLQAWEAHKKNCPIDAIKRLEQL